MSKKLWGGRFNKKTDPLVEEFTKSIHYDKKLAEYDVLGSVAHVAVLEQCGYLTKEEASSLKKGLSLVYDKTQDKKFNPGARDEDIHTYIQNELQKKVGKTALKLHTARSRNDQVVFATKLYCKENIEQIKKYSSYLLNALMKLNAFNPRLIIPGFTHLQHAQPVYLKDYLWAYMLMLNRDINRLSYISKNIKISMGAGALAGTPIKAALYNIKTEELFKAFANTGIPKYIDFMVTANSLDTVSDRDFVIEIVSALSIIAMHLSRLSEDLIIWSTKEFDFIEIDEAYCTGSSLMPQKKNPDALELIRGYAGRLNGNLISVLTMMKGLPLTYNRDMQLDKEPLFDSFEIVSKELKVLRGLIETLKFNKEKIAEHLKDESLYATDLMYYLVNRGVAFKEAHTVVGKLVKYSIDSGIEIKAMHEDKIRSFSEKFIKSEIAELFNPIVSVKSKRSINRKQSLMAKRQARARLRVKTYQPK